MWRILEFENKYKDFLTQTVMVYIFFGWNILRNNYFIHFYKALTLRKEQYFRKF